MKPLRWSPTSRRDVARIADWLGAIDRGVASETLASIRACSWRIREFPFSGPEIGTTGYRKLIVTGTPYLLVYRVTADLVEISRVRHAHEDWAAR